MLVEDLRGHLGDSVEVQGMLESKIVELERGYRELVSAVEGRNKAWSELKAQSAALTDENTSLKSHISPLETELHSTRDQIKSLTEKLDFLTAETAAYQQTAPSPPSKPSESLKEKLRKSEQIIETLKLENAKLKSSAGDRMTTIRSNVALKQQIDHLKTDIHRLELEAEIPKKAAIGLLAAFVLAWKERVVKTWVLGMLVKDRGSPRLSSHPHENVTHLKDKIDELRVRHRNLFSQILALIRAKENTSLDLSRCGIPQDWLELLFTSFSQCERLSDINLSYNRLGDAVISYILRCEEAGKRLRKVNLGYIGMTSAGLSQLLEGLKTSQLEGLDVSGTPANVLELAEFVRGKATLKELGIADIGLQHPADISALADALAESQVHSLDISSNPLPSAKLHSLLMQLSKQSWSRLYLSSISLLDSHTDLLCQLLQHSPYLQEISLAYTRLSASSLEHICEALASCKELCKLDASGTAVPVAAMCRLLQSCPGLLELQMKGIALTGEEFALLGEAVAQATNLQVCLIDPPLRSDFSLV
jgi:hypothetical protein